MAIETLPKYRDLNKTINGTLKETGWYDPRKLLGSLAVPEMRASTLAARALCLDPSYVKVPCVGGTEGDALVPLFSKAVDLFDFTLQNAEMLVHTIRDTPAAVVRSDGDCIRAAELSEAHAIAGLVTKVAWALLCKDVPRLSAFVETDSSQIISPARFMGNTVEIDSGIIKNLGLMRMSDNETTLLNLALGDILMRQEMVRDWYMKYRCSSPRLDEFEDRFYMPKCYKRLQDCAHASV